MKPPPEVLKRFLDARLIDHEREKRRRAVAFGQASVELEGFKISDEEKRWAQLFVDGEITLKEFVEGRRTSDTSLGNGDAAG